MKSLSSLILICLFGFSQNSFAQEDFVPVPQHLVLNTSPLSFIILGSRISLGIDYYNGKQLGFNLDIGLGKSPMRKNVPNRKNYSFFEVKPQIKHYFKQRKDRKISFLALEYFYSKFEEDITKTDFFYPLGSIPKIHYNGATYTLTNKGLRLVTGFKIQRNKVFFEFHFGAGLTLQTSKYSKLIDPIVDSRTVFTPSSFLDFSGIFQSDFRTEVKNEPFFSPSLGFKIGYVFWQK